MFNKYGRNCTYLLFLNISDSVRSPKEKRSKDSESRSNHERSDSEKKSRLSVSKYDKRSVSSANMPLTIHQIGEWSEHLSSSGKKYYYNCISEVSQWEKPREWDSRRMSSKDSTYSSRSSKLILFYLQNLYNHRLHTSQQSDPYPP